MTHAEAERIRDRMAKLANGALRKPGNGSAEATYGELYQRLVRGGHAPQLRAKYRGR